MCPIGYYMMLRNYKDPKQLRLKLVLYADEHGKKAAARRFATTVSTVRKWHGRWKIKGLAGLEEMSRRPHNCPNAISQEVRKHVIAIKKGKKTLGAVRLKEMYSVPCSEKAMRNIWRANGLLVKRRKKHKTKQDLREMKMKWRLFEQVDADTKHLYDIPEYWSQMKRLGLPKYQYTARDVVSGLQFIGYSQDLSLLASTFFAKRIIAHLIQNNALSGGHFRWQTDNGSEFIGSTHAKQRSVFSVTVESFKNHVHCQIPPGAHTFQADVETVHDRIEDEFYCLETFKSRSDFLAKATSYQHYFNLVRKNYSKQGKTPMQILKERNPNLSPAITQLPPVFLDELVYAKSNQGGYDVGKGSYIQLALMG